MLLLLLLIDSPLLLMLLLLLQLVLAEHENYDELIDEFFAPAINRRCHQRKEKE